MCRQAAFLQFPVSATPASQFAPGAVLLLFTYLRVAMCAI